MLFGATVHQVPVDVESVGIKFILKKNYHKALAKDREHRRSSICS